MKFGQYELLERVAVGGMAEVYRGRVAGAEGFEKLVAIKRILPEFARDDRFIALMLTEARIHSALSHRNIVQIHDLGISEDGEYFIVLEYVEGDDLRSLMEAAAELGVQIPDALALHIADELAQALHFAHELKGPAGQPLGIIHRDVSPSNVLISNSGEVKLSDFGIAKRRHEHSVVGSLKGNLVYMSPEQARRVPLDRRTDVFALGAVLFEMLTGQKPREIKDEATGFREVASGVVRSARAFRPDLPEAYVMLLSRALAADPVDRFQDAASFGAALRELRRGNDAPVGPADMKELIELIEVLSPPRQARSPVERSKVIRLGPEFRMLAATSRGPAGPGEIPVETPNESYPPDLAPGVVPAVSRPTKSNGNGAPNWADGGGRLAAVTPDAASQMGQMGSMGPTPQPPVVPSRALEKSERKPRPEGNGGDLDETGGESKNGGSSRNGKTGSQGSIDGHARAAQLGRAADPQATPPPPPAGDVTRPPATTPPIADPQTVADQFSAEAAMSKPTPPPTPGAFSASEGFAPAVAPSTDDPDPAWTGPRGGAGPTPQAVVLRPGARAPMPISLPTSPTSNNRFTPAPHLTAADIRHEPPRGAGRSIAVALLAIVATATAVVHYKFIPLDVLVAWQRPAWLIVSSDPAGAEVKLDGRTLPDLTPTRIEVRRDLAEHVLEFARPGSRSVRTTIRFHRSVALSQTVSLPTEPAVPPTPDPLGDVGKAPTPTTRVSGAESDHLATKAENHATKPAGKKKSKKQKSKKSHKKNGGDEVDVVE